MFFVKLQNYIYYFYLVNFRVLFIWFKLIKFYLRDHDAPYILLISCWYLCWMSLRLSLKAAVTSPISGDHTSVHSLTAAGISNFSSLPETDNRNEFII